MGTIGELAKENELLCRIDLNSETSQEEFLFGGIGRQRVMMELLCPFDDETADRVERVLGECFGLETVVVVEGGLLEGERQESACQGQRGAISRSRRTGSLLLSPVVLLMA